MILFHHDDSIFIKGVFGPLEKLYCVFVSQVWKDPLNPDHVVLLCESEVLQPWAVKVSACCAFEDLFCLLHVFLALVDDIYLN
jgi:hypothetical protein